MVSENPILCARIQAKVDQVVNLLREEVQAHKAEHWREALGRIMVRTGVVVSLLERHDLWGGVPRLPNGNNFLGTALSKAYVVVDDPHERWRLVFKLGTWETAEDAAQAIVNRDDTAPSTAPEGGNLEGAMPAALVMDSEAPCTGGFSCSPLPTSPPSKQSVVEPSQSVRPSSPTRTHNGPVPPVYNEAFLIREFDRRERDRGPIYAGFIVNDLLPRMGFDASDGKRILRAMEAQDMVRTEQKPNPKDPQRTTSFVTLNREHPHVARVLCGAAAIQRSFPIGTIEGEPLSQTIIRERM